jgi:chromosome segregation ATPase
VNRIAKLMQGLTATGRHRAADRIPVIEAERDAWLAKAEAAQAKLDHADALITKVCSEKSSLRVAEARLTEQVERLTEANALLEADLDELGARLIAARQELANALAVYSPAPADHGPAIALLDDTVETNVSTLWNAHGLRPVA